ncbi:MAG: DUF6174 domain-containing protein [Candidatus Rariloculaceae bacterium]
MISAKPPLVFLFAAIVVSNSYADDELELNRALWTAAGISSYVYRYEKVCECHRDIPAETIVTVEDGQVVGVRYAREDYLDEMPVAPKEYRWFRTIDDLFSLIATAAESATTLRVAYDPELGYPEYLYIDYDLNLVGDEVELEVTGFEPAN